MAARRKRRKKQKSILPIVLFFLIVILIVGFVFISKDKAPTFNSGIKVEGVDISGMTLQKAKAKLQREEASVLDKVRINVESDTQSYEIAYDDIDAKTNLDDILSHAIEFKSGQKQEFSLLISYDENKLLNAVEDICEKLSKEPIEPEIKSFDFETKEFVLSKGENGYEANSEKLLSDIKTILENLIERNEDADTSAYVEVNEVSTKLSNEELENSFGEIAYFSTECRNNESSEHNMRLAMQLMNKTVVKAGGIISFNDTVGDSTTEEGGWVKSGAWVNGELTEQYGGGLCQAATTLYNCALLANMEVEERFCHLQPSDYCTIGLDATIDYGNLDLIMKNTSDYPIYIISEMNGKILEMTMYGYISEDYDYIELYGEQTGTIDMPKAQYQVDEDLSSGEYKLSRKGYTGKTASATRIWYDENGNVIKSEDLPGSNYSAVAPIYKIASDVDTDKIPEGSEEGVIEEEIINEVPSGGGVTTHGPTDVPLG